MSGISVYHVRVCKICIKCNYLDLYLYPAVNPTVQALLIWVFSFFVPLDWGASMQAVWEDILQHGSGQATHPLCASGTGPETCLHTVYC